MIDMQKSLLCMGSIDVFDSGPSTIFASPRIQPASGGFFVAAILPCVARGLLLTHADRVHY